LKNGFAAAQKSFSLLFGLHVIMIDYRVLNSITDRRKTFDSLLANHFSAVMQSSQGIVWRLFKNVQMQGLRNPEP